MSNKIRKHVTLDEDLCVMAETKLGMPLSTFFNIALSEELNASDEIEDVKKEIANTESHLTFLRSKLCRLEKDKAMNIDQQKSLELAFSTLERIYNAHGQVGENQINNVAGNYPDVTFAELKGRCDAAGFTVVKAFEPIRETKESNGGPIR